MKISIMMLYYRLHWTLWILTCFGQYLCQDLQIPAANGALGESVVLAPDNPPSTSIQSIQWSFTTTPIVIVTSAGTAITDSYIDRVSFDMNTLALELKNLRLYDSGIYELRVTLNGAMILTGTTSLQVFVKVSDVKLTGPDKPLIEGNSTANITSEGFGSITSVEWMKDNSPLSPSNSIIFSPDNRSVSISPVQRSDSGEYQCTYSNPVSSETAKLHLIINFTGEGGAGLTTGAIVGIVIGALVAVSGICGLIVYLMKTKKIPMFNKEQKEASGAAQCREEPDSNYEEIIDIQKIRRDGAAPMKRSDSTVYENYSYEENEYENVEH